MTRRPTLRHAPTLGFRPALMPALPLAAALALLLAAAAPAAAQRVVEPRVVATPGDHIVAVVNRDLVTAVELGRRQALIRQGALRAGQPVPPPAALRAQALESLIEERVIVTHARDLGWRIDEAEIDRAVQSVAAQNQLSAELLRERLQIEGLDMARFRAQLRDQIAVERTREQEVIARIVVTEEEVDRALQAERDAARASAPVNIAQILVAVPEGADAALLAERRQRAEQALARVRAGEDFAALARELSDDASRERGGELGLRPPERLPDLFVDAVRGLEPGQVAAAPVRSGAGFHVLKVVQREASADEGTVVETRARHILLRTSDQATPEQAARRLLELKRQIESGQRRFEDVAREVSEDGSAAAGGDLGWFGPGVMVPEFAEPASRLAPGTISEPVLSRFGVHLIQVLERRRAEVPAAQRREQARNVLRERKFEQAYQDWVDELRARAYVEIREPELSTAQR
jgi:peptidyl-prolyl cis-trans isomerase SurA